MNYQDVAGAISSKLGLASPPVALSFVESEPSGMPVSQQDVPSACTFWRQAETSVFYAPAEKHFNCPIGAMTMGFEMPSDVQQNLMGVVQKMCGVGYISADEPANIPTVKKKKSGIVYGPLHAFPMEPDLVLMWLTPAQAMVYGEAAGTCRWTESMPAATFGRPSCAALPVAFARAQSTLSLGCLGMRIFTDISENRLLAVLPGGKIDEFCRALESVSAANREMGIFYRGHKSNFAV